MYPELSIKMIGGGADKRVGGSFPHTNKGTRDCDVFGGLRQRRFMPVLLVVQELLTTVCARFFENM